MSTRRELLKKTAFGAGLGALAVASAPALAEMMCIGVTPAQTEGPFYPIAEQLDSDNDLTYVRDHAKKAEGDVLYLKGAVTDGECRAVPNALVEIWQACATGKYNHPGDPNPAALDPNFQYFGRCLTDANGEYLFKTIRPGAYPASANWMRPAHIHVKVHVRGYEELTTQMYFSDDPLNAQDLILQSHSAEERQRLIVEFSTVEGVDAPMGRFDIRIKKIVGLS